MPNVKDGAAGVAYARKASEENRRYAHDLLADNERLRARQSLLEHEQDQLLKRAQLTEHLLAEHEAMRGVVVDLVQEKVGLVEQIQGLQDELARRAEDAADLRERLSSIETESRRFSQEYVDVERRNNDLLNLYVASYRLHGTVERAEVLETIRDIVANLVGCEEQALFETDEDGGLRLVDSVGIDPEPWRVVRAGDGEIGRAALQGEVYVAPPAPDLEHAPELTACIPLKLNGRVTGAIALFRMLPQKPALAEADHEMLDLLATHAATALYCTRLHELHAAGEARS